MFLELLAEILILGLVVWRISYALSTENGPFEIFRRLRKLSNPDAASGLIFLALRPLTCFNCLVAATGSGAALLIKKGWLLFLVSWLAISAVALIIDLGVNPPLELHATED